jgi:hypothetical protein
MASSEYRVIKSHEPELCEPLVVAEGTRLHFERRPTKWEGWLWCTTAEGESGWVPEAWVELEGEHCIMLRAYDTTELSVNPGDAIRALLIESGWVFGATRTGTLGWVPLECLEAE